MMRTAEVIVDTTEFKMTGEGKWGVGNRPGAAGEGCNEFAEGKIEPFDESGFDKPRETESLKGGAVGVG